MVRRGVSLQNAATGLQVGKEIIMTYQQARQITQQLTGRTPRWCEVRDHEDQLAPAPTPEAMDDCIALDANGHLTQVARWQDQRPFGRNVEAVCYF